MDGYNERVEVGAYPNAARAYSNSEISSFPFPLKSILLKIVAKVLRPTPPFC